MTSDDLDPYATEKAWKVSAIRYRAERDEARAHAAGLKVALNDCRHHLADSEAVLARVEALCVAADGYDSHYKNLLHVAQVRAAIQGGDDD